jgi:hypothetical protein
VAYGADLEQAYMKMETVEHFAKIALVTHQLGIQQPLGAAEVEKLIVVRAKYQNGLPSSAASMPVNLSGPDGNHHRKSTKTTEERDAVTSRASK